MAKASKLLISATILLLIILGNLNKANAQCIENLRRARTVYNEGRLHEIYDVLKDCLVGNDLNEEEKTEAYRLLILAYIFQDQPLLADDAMLSLLNINPRYKPIDATDPNELINLYKTFRTDPIYRWGLKGSVNYSIVNITSVVNSSNSSNGAYTGNINVGFHGFVEKDFFNKLITFRVEPSVSLYKMTYVAAGFPNSFGINTTTWEDVESQAWIGLNLLARYPLFKKNKKFWSKISPNIILGASAQYLMRAASANTTSIQEGESPSTAELDFVLDNNRQKINISGVAGIGFIFKMSKISLITDVTYRYGLVNITDKHTSSSLTFLHARSLNNMNLSTVNVAVGVMFNKYSPKKLIND